MNSVTCREAMWNFSNQVETIFYNRHLHQILEEKNWLMVWVKIIILGRGNASKAWACEFLSARDPCRKLVAAVNIFIRL